MTVFNDITGWREELNKLRNSDAITKLHGTGTMRVGPDPKIPLSVLFDYAETLLKHEEMREALIAIRKWSAKQTEDFLDAENDPTYPHMASELLSEFVYWYQRKTGYGPNWWAYKSHGGQLATRTILREFSSVRGLEARQYILDKATFEIDVDK